MRVRMKTLGAGPEGLWPPGTVIHVGEGLGKALVAGGYAEEVPELPVTSEQPVASELPEVERAVDVRAEARQTAAAPAQRRRK